MPPDINLEATETEARRASARERARAKSDTSKKETPNIEAELRSRLARTFDRIAEAVEARGDEELATVIREDSAAMGAGLISLTNGVKQLRTPLLFALSLIEPVLAFGRVFRVLGSRLAARRYERQDAAETGMTAQDGTVPGPVAA